MKNITIILILIGCILLSTHINKGVGVSDSLALVALYQ